MTKTLRQAALQAYVGLASMFLPIENQMGLIADIEADSVVGHALGCVTCELFYRFGMYLAPLTAVITTAKHCKLEYRTGAEIMMSTEPEISTIK